MQMILANAGDAITGTFLLVMIVLWVIVTIVRANVFLHDFFARLFGVQPQARDSVDHALTRMDRQAKKRSDDDRSS